MVNLIDLFENLYVFSILHKKALILNQKGLFPQLFFFHDFLFIILGKFKIIFPTIFIGTFFPIICVNFMTKNIAR